MKDKATKEMEDIILEKNKLEEEFTKINNKANKIAQNKVIAYKSWLGLVSAYSLFFTVFLSIKSEIFKSDVKIFVEKLGEIKNTFKIIPERIVKALNEKMEISSNWSDLIYVILNMTFLILLVILIYFMLKELVAFYKKYCWDNLTIGFSLISLSICMIFAQEIRQISEINLILILIASQIVYAVLRWYFKGLRI